MSQPEQDADTDTTPSTPTAPTPNTAELLNTFRTHLTEDQFRDWHMLQERERNAEEGYGDTRNDPSHTPSSDTHSPSSLLSCHRMAYYKANNTPREEDLPYGIFKFGHDFEAYAQQFLQDVVSTPRTEVRNVERINFEEHNATFTGSTDPVIFDNTGKPIALFEVKTSKNVYFVRKNGAKKRHRAQAHAYARGLQEKYDLESPPPIFFIYGGREDLDVVMIEEEFDHDFWENTVVDWALENSEYRDGDELPPAVDPDGPLSYMCGYCDFAERCGNYEPDSKSPNSDAYVEQVDDYWWDDSIATDFQNTVRDSPSIGFLPLKKYPEDAVIAHLATYPDVKLTPTLAVQYPDLVDDGEEPPERLERLYGAAPQREVGDWVCPKCLETFEFGTFDWDGDFDNLPSCPDCPDDPSLRGPKPGEVLLN